METARPGPRGKSAVSHPGQVSRSLGPRPGQPPGPALENGAAGPSVVPRIPVPASSPFSNSLRPSPRGGGLPHPRAAFPRLKGVTAVPEC